MARSYDHFISVSRQGALMARRKGCAPVEVAGVEGVLVTTDDAARARGVPAEVRVRLGPGGSHRSIRVLEVEIASARIEIGVFQARFEVDDARLGRWLRVAVDAALDRAAASTASGDEHER